MPEGAAANTFHTLTFPDPVYIPKPCVCGPLENS